MEQVIMWIVFMICACVIFSGFLFFGDDFNFTTGERVFLLIFLFVITLACGIKVIESLCEYKGITIEAFLKEKGWDW